MPAEQPEVGLWPGLTLFPPRTRVVDLDQRHGVVEFVHVRADSVELTVLLDGNTTAVRAPQTRFVEEMTTT